MCWRRGDTDTHTHKHTHTNTYTHTHNAYQQSLIITQQQSIRQSHNCVTVFSVDRNQEQQEVLKVKYWLYSWEKGKETGWKTERHLIKLGIKISCKLSLRTGYTVYHLWAVIECCLFWWLCSKRSTHKNCDEIVGPAHSCVVICVIVQCELVIILNANISSFCLGFTGEIKKYTKKVSLYFGFLCRDIIVLWGRSE